MITTRQRPTLLSWIALLLPLLYMFIPLASTLQFSLQAKRGEIGFSAYSNVLALPEFVSSFNFSFWTAILTIVIGTAIIVPTCFWVTLRLPQWRQFVEFFVLISFVTPTVVLVFGLVRAHNLTGLTNTAQGVYILLLGAYITRAFPYMYRSVDAGLRAINVRVLTEAAQSLGANWFTILARVILPNIIVAVLNGAFVTFAIVITEYTIAALLSQPAFGPFMQQIGTRKVYEPSALTILSLVLTWLCVGVFQYVGRRSVGAPISGV